MHAISCACKRICMSILNTIIGCVVWASSIYQSRRCFFLIFPLQIHLDCIYNLHDTEYIRQSFVFQSERVRVSFGFKADALFVFVYKSNRNKINDKLSSVIISLYHITQSTISFIDRYFASLNSWFFFRISHLHWKSA